MSNEIQYVRSRLNEKAKLQQAHKQLLKLLILSSGLLFATLLGIGLVLVMPEIEMPKIFYVGTIIILLSSVSLEATKRAIAGDELQRAVYLLVISLGLGVAFGVMQLIGWSYLLEADTLGRNILLPFSAIHFLHLMVGLIFLLVVFFRLNDFQIHSRAMLFATNVIYFWHFLGLIWLVFIGVIA